MTRFPTPRPSLSKETAITWPCWQYWQWWDIFEHSYLCTPIVISENRETALPLVGFSPENLLADLLVVSRRQGWCFLLLLNKHNCPIHWHHCLPPALTLPMSSEADFRVFFSLTRWDRRVIILLWLTPVNKNMTNVGPKRPFRCLYIDLEGKEVQIVFLLAPCPISPTIKENIQGTHTYILKE